MGMSKITSTRPLPALRLLRRAGRIVRDDTGVTAIEFGMLALPFFAMIAAIMETGITFLARNVFESALHDSVRLIRTGQAQQQSYDAEQFRAEICNHTYGLFDCGKIRMRITTIGSFTDADTVSPVDTDTAEWTIAEAYEPGGGRSIVLAQAYYKWDTLFDIFGFNLASLSDGTLLMGSAEVWRNEPFAGNGGT